MLDLFVAGLPLGAMYGLAALALVVVHRATGNVDLSGGGVAATAAYGYHELSTNGTPRVAALGLALLMGAACGGLSAAAARLIGAGRPLVFAVASLAWGGVLTASCLLAFGSETDFVAPFWSGSTVQIGDVILSAHQILVGAVAVLLVAAGVVVLRWTSVGLAWRACADGRHGATLVGLRVGRIEVGSYVLAGTLSAAAGVLVVPLLYLDATALTLFFLLKPAAAAVAGGLLSLPGALAAGMLIGVAESLCIKVTSVPGLGESVPVLVAGLALLLRPPARGRERPDTALAPGATGLPGSGRVLPAALGVAAASVVLPVLTPYQHTIAQLALITGLLAATHVVLTGWSGQLSLAQPAFAGIGAFCAARAANGADQPFLLSLLVGALAGAAAAGVLGLLASRVTGLRFALLTLAFGGAISGTLLTWSDFAGSAEDRTVEPPSLFSVDLSGDRYTSVVLVLVALTFLGLRSYARSSWGAVAIAAREHDRAAAGLGLPVAAARWVTLAVTGAVAGLAGSLTAFQLGIVGAEQFHPLFALPILAAAVLGGVESLWGAFLGAVVLTLAPELLRQADAPQAAALVAPALLLLIVLVRPGGLVPAGYRRAPVGERRALPPIGGSGLQTVELTVRYGSQVALDGVNLTVAPGEVVALIGANGAGKTTLLDAVAGARRPVHGTVRVADADFRPRPWRSPRRGSPSVVRTLQSGGLFGRLSVADNLAVVGRVHGARRPPRVLDDLLGTTAGDLAHGTARLVEIARAVACSPNVLLLDEPAAGLSHAEADAMLAYVRAAAFDAAVLLVEHNRFVVEQCDRVVVLDEGVVVAVGTPAEIYGSDQVRAVYGEDIGARVQKREPAGARGCRPRPDRFARPSQEAE